MTHKNLISTALFTNQFIPPATDPTVISYLPYPHSFEQILSFMSVVFRYKIGYYQGDPLKLTEDCAMLKPTMFPSVPRLYNKIYQKLQAGVAAAKGIKGCLVNMGLSAKTKATNRTGATTNGCYDAIIFKKMKAILGGRVSVMITGSAPIDKDVLKFLKVCFCCPFLEGYGLTESSAASSITRKDDPIVGHVGGPIPCVKWRLMDVPEMNYLSTDKPYPRGELCMKGRSIFSGYYKRPEKNAEAFDEEGWFKTGDVAMVFPNGATKIIDRSKNIFKLSQGEYIAPEKIENVFGLSPWIAQSWVTGDSMKNNTVAVIVPNPDALKKWASEHGKLLYAAITCI